MELRQLEAFVVVADELHFGRAAAALHIGQPTLSDMVRRLERELRAELLTRTTRRVALTAAGEEFLVRARDVLDRVAAAKAAVQLVGAGEAGTVRVGITPPVAPVLVPHLQVLASEHLPGVELDVRRMWLPALTSAIADGTVDIALTCGLPPDPPGVVTQIIGAEPLLVGLRPDHRLATRGTVALADLRDEVLGVPDPDLFPAWELAVRQALAQHDLDPPTAQLDDADLGAARWADQACVSWVLLVDSIVGAHRSPTLPVAPQAFVPYVLQWNPGRVMTPAVSRLVDLARTGRPPAGWTKNPY